MCGELENRVGRFKKDIFKDNATIVYRSIYNNVCDVSSCLIMNEGLVQERIVNGVVKVLMMSDDINVDHKLKYLMESKIVAKSVYMTEDEELMIKEILRGNTLILVQGERAGILVETRSYTQRGISEPQAESVLRGPREGFNEVMMTNISLVRRRITNPELKIEIIEKGKRSNTKIAICYVADLVNRRILKEIKKRIDKIDIDYLISTGKITEFIEDHPKSPFRTIGITERPDVVCSKILDGKIAIICDGTPVALTIPYLFHEYFEANEDDYNHYIYSSINRVLRYLSFFIGSSMPALYVAAVTFHRELIPTQLSLSIYLSRVGVPFPTVFECFVMMIMFEVIREAAIRLPKHIGPAISIVGALVLGDAAVKAKFVSSPMVIVIAATEISALLLADMQEALIFLRFLFLIATSIWGLYGYVFSVMGVCIHLMGMQSFGVKYMAYMGNLDKKNIYKTLVRGPWWTNRFRNEEIAQDTVKSSTKENLGDENEEL